MMRFGWRLVFSALFSASMAISGCSCDESEQPLPGDDRGTSSGRDSGSNGAQDTGTIVPVDGGFDDQGNPVDGGFTEFDSGTPEPADGGFDDQGNPVDGGFVEADSGGPIPVDGGFVEGDAAPPVPVDGGFDDQGNPVDGGFVEGDAAPPVPVDGGFIDPDSGASPVDGGFVEGDAAPPVPVDGGFAAADAAPPVPVDGGFNDQGVAVDGGFVAADAAPPVPVDGGFVAADAAPPVPVDGGFVAADATAGSDAAVTDRGVSADSGTRADATTGSDASAADARAADATAADAAAADARVADAAVADAGTVTDGGVLGQPRAQFCQGSGTVVEVGANGQCSGNIAQETFRFALCTCEQASVQSNLEVDAFNSSRGAYGAVTNTGINILDDGHVGTNGPFVIGGMLTDRGSVFVSGGGYTVGQQSSVSINVYSHDDAIQPNSSSSIGRNAFVNGDVLGRFEIGRDLHVPVGATVDPTTTVGGQIVRGAIPTIVPCPCAEDEKLDIQSIVDWGRMVNDNAAEGIDPNLWANGTGPDVITLPCGRYYLTRILHPRGITIHALGRTVLYVDGDVTLGGGLRIEVDPGAELDSFIVGGLALQAASRLGEQDRPSSVRTYVGGSTPIMIQANSVFGGNLYAPNADIIFGASANLYGALFGQSVSFSGSAEVHYDSLIRTAGDQCQPPSSPDAGVADSGARDSGTPDTGVRDAGDGGAAGTDAGSTATDSGPADSGVRLDATVVADSGIRDSGTPDSGTPDSGPPDGGVCTRCYECVNQACIIGPTGGGMCGPCNSDLDCCPTDICVNGSCIPTL